MQQGFAAQADPYVLRATGGGERYRGLLAVSEAIVSYRDLPTLFHELAGRLHEVVQFDWLGVVLLDDARQTFYRSACRPVHARPARAFSEPTDAERLAELAPPFGIEFV